ncbi:hypothetical protein ES705_48639 [subsurface metagenome]
MAYIMSMVSMIMSRAWATRMRCLILALIVASWTQVHRSILFQPRRRSYSPSNGLLLYVCVPEGVGGSTLLGDYVPRNGSP